MNARIDRVGAPIDAARPGTTDSEDREMIARIALGDRAAFAAFYQCFQPRLRGFLRRLTYRADLIEDIINDTMFAVWQQAATFRCQSLVSTWLLGIAYRCGCRSLRAHTQGGRTFDNISHIDPGVADGPLHDVETDDWLSKALAALPVKQRTVMVLTYYSGHSCAEIAELMQCSVNTVKTRMFHARRKLRASSNALA